MKARGMLMWLAFMLAGTAPAPAADFQAGVASVKITPPLPFWLSGYAARTNPAPAVRTDLYAKALALKDSDGGRVVIVTTDLIGLPGSLSDAVAARLGRLYGLERRQILFNSSHTHSGPAVWPNLQVMFNFDSAEVERARRYAMDLAENLVAVAAAALDRLEPARLFFGRGEADFAVNRRQPSPTGVRLGVNTNGPVDHTVPVLKVETADGLLRAVLFGYACHNTTLGGDSYVVDGDYAGAAQRAVEKAHPGVTAMFMILCGGDQNPNPRGLTNHVEQHGLKLAAAVERCLGGTMQKLTPPLRSSWVMTKLDFAPHTREQFVQEAEEKNVYKQRRAALMLEAYDAGKPVRQLSYPVQVLRMGRALTLLGLGGEVVVDYSLRARREFSSENLVVSGYCNDVSCYIPSARVLREGGYEPVDSMIYYGLPGPFAESVEEIVFNAIKQALETTR